MVIDADIYRSAQMLIDSFGDDAHSVAELRVEAMQSAGVAQGVTVWRLILTAVQEINRDASGMGERIH